MYIIYCQFYALISSVQSWGWGGRNRGFGLREWGSHSKRSAPTGPFQFYLFFMYPRAVFKRDVSSVKWFLSAILSEIETVENTFQWVVPIAKQFREICFGNDATMTSKLP